MPRHPACLFGSVLHVLYALYNTGMVFLVHDKINKPFLPVSVDRVHLYLHFQTCLKQNKKTSKIDVDNPPNSRH